MLWSGSSMVLSQEFSPQKGPPALPRFVQVVHLLSAVEARRSRPPTRRISRTILRARCIGKAPDNPKIPFGDRIVETDWRLFCTLVRFDAVYHGHFKSTSAESVTIRTWTVTCSATDLFQKAISITRKLTCLDCRRGKGGFLFAYRKPFWQGLSELKSENSTAGFRARFQFLACRAETRDHLIMPAQAYTVNSGLTILGKALDAGATFDGDVAKGIGQLKAGHRRVFSTV
jgi:hypothetical protein